MGGLCVMSGVGGLGGDIVGDIVGDIMSDIVGDISVILV